jgi:hypothetical protein
MPASRLRSSRNPRDQRNPLSHHLYGTAYDPAQRPQAELFADNATE